MHVRNAESDGPDRSNRQVQVVALADTDVSLVRSVQVSRQLDELQLPKLVEVKLCVYEMSAVGNDLVAQESKVGSVLCIEDDPVPNTS